MQVVDYGFPVLFAKTSSVFYLPIPRRVPIGGRIQFGPTISLRSGGSNLPHLVVPSLHLPWTAPVLIVTTSDNRIGLLGVSLLGFQRGSWRFKSLKTTTGNVSVERLLKAVCG